MLSPRLFQKTHKELALKTKKLFHLRWNFANHIKSFRPEFFNFAATTAKFANMGHIAASLATFRPTLTYVKAIKKTKPRLSALSA